MRRVITMSIFIIFGFIIQTTLFQHIQIYSIKPDLIIIIIVCYAMLRTDIEGALIGLLAGLIVDIFLGRILGTNMLLYMLIGYFSGKPFKEFSRSNFFFPTLIVIISTMIYETAFYVTNYLFRGRMNFVFYFYRIISSETLYNICLTPIVYFIVLYFNQRLEDHEKEYTAMF